MTKIKPRREAKVIIHSTGSFIGEKTVIHPRPEGGYDLLLSKTQSLVATCEYAKRLADWAFDNGADEVSHDYHLGLSDWEP